MTEKQTWVLSPNYQKGATIPDGNTEFQFMAGDLNFDSSSYDWLVVSGGTKSIFKGTGTTNGAGNYGKFFMLYFLNFVFCNIFIIRAIWKSVMANSVLGPIFP